MTDPIDIASRIDHDFQKTAAATDSDAPYFGEIDLNNERDGKVRRYKVGAVANPDHAIVSRFHPIGAAFHELRPGDAYELTEGYADLHGELVSKSGIKAKMRRVEQVAHHTVDGRVEVFRGEAGNFEVLDHRSAVPRTRADLDDLMAFITPAQYRLITKELGRPLIIRGRAGSGKTTVALHRLAWLIDREAPSGEAVQASNILMVMYNRGLMQFVRATHQKLGLGDIKLNTFHGWALEQIQGAYRGDLQFKSTAGPDAKLAADLKRQVGILKALDAFVEAQTRRLDEWLERRLQPFDPDRQWLSHWRGLTGPVIRRLAHVRDSARDFRDGLNGVERERAERVLAVIKAGKARVTQYKEELPIFLSDAQLLSQHLNASASELDILGKAARANAKIDSTERRPGPYVTYEDAALLLRLILAKHGGFPGEEDGSAHLYDHLVVDETQDFGAVELEVLLSSVRTRSGVTLVGDLNQQILRSDFAGWEALAKQIGLDGIQVADLEVAHRSSRPIMLIADPLVGDVTDSTIPGSKPTLTRVEPSERNATLVQLVRSRLDEADGIHVAVVCRQRQDATTLVPILAAALSGTSVRVGERESWTFGPGVTVTSTHQIKGLEFDTVILVDTSPEDFPDTDAGRRLLYTTITRARAHFDALNIGSLTALLEEASKDGRLEVRDLATVPDFEPEEDDDQPL